MLGFLHLRGLTPLALAAAVPPVAGWRDTAIPKTLTATDVQALIDSCNPTHSAGARDYAIMVARLGLRSAEVARLQLGDVDWRAGEVLIRGKTRRQDRLPLPVEVGEALAIYLHDARPRIQDRAVFVTCHPPAAVSAPTWSRASCAGCACAAAFPRSGRIGSGTL